MMARAASMLMRCCSGSEFIVSFSWTEREAGVCREPYSWQALLSASTVVHDNLLQNLLILIKSL